MVYRVVLHGKQVYLRPFGPNPSSTMRKQVVEDLCSPSLEASSSCQHPSALTGSVDGRHDVECFERGVVCDGTLHHSSDAFGSVRVRQGCEMQGNGLKQEELGLLHDPLQNESACVFAGVGFE